MSFTCIPVQIEPNKSPLRRKLLALLLWEIVHLPPQAKNKKQQKKNHLFFFYRKRMITHLPSSFLPQGLCICCSFCLVFFFYFCLVPSIIQISIQMLSLHRNFPWASYSCYPSLLLSHFMTSHCFIFFTLWNYCMYLCTCSFCFTHLNISSIGTEPCLYPQNIKSTWHIIIAQHTFAEGRYNATFHTEIPYE